MNYIQVIYVFIATFFLSFGILFFAQSVFIFKTINSRFYFALASLAGTIFVFCSALLSSHEPANFIIIIQRVKVISLLIAILLWIISIYKLYLVKSKIPFIFSIYIAILSVPIIFAKNSFHYPINKISYKFFNQSYCFNYATPHPLLIASLIPICIVLFITGYKLIKTKINIPKTIKSLLVGATALALGTAFHDVLVINGYISAHPLLLDIVLVVFFIATFSIYFDEQKHRVKRLENINKELDRKVKENTEEIDSISQQLWVALQEQKQVCDSRSEMLQIAAHDMKSPLQGIIGYSELLMVQFRDNKPLVDRLNKILKSADDMLYLIQGMLEYEINNATKHEMHISEIKFSELTEYIIDKNLSKAMKKKQNLTFEIEPECKIKGDNKKVMEILDNLIDNAIKYSKLNESIFISVKKDKNNIIFSIKDSGPGLTNNDKQLIFKKFQRLSAKPTAEENSTGIGLYIVNKFVTMHGGKIQIDSEPNKGTTFTITFPKNFQKKSN